MSKRVASVAWLLLLLALGAGGATIAGRAFSEREATALALPSGLAADIQAGPASLKPLGDLAADFDVTRAGRVILGAGKGLTVLQAGAVRRLLLDVPIESFALDADDNLLTVSAGYFGR